MPKYELLLSQSYDVRVALEAADEEAARDRIAEGILALDERQLEAASASESLQREGGFTAAPF